MRTTKGRPIPVAVDVNVVVDVNEVVGVNERKAEMS
ncbi:hypothetical protein BMIN_1573 [Bifidobacterium minimum]|uniref:Uncharacterized protein n=1 Tax=Bifidobacterium minimum TaxID=1693 RepID=A0A087BLY7_9BIFI|nr:hypothetical protein BMIN_1573 [Bifidobacterium minimum]